MVAGNRCRQSFLVKLGGPQPTLDLCSLLVAISGCLWWVLGYEEGADFAASSVLGTLLQALRNRL